MPSSFVTSVNMVDTKNKSSLLFKVLLFVSSMVSVVFIKIFFKTVFDLLFQYTSTESILFVAPKPKCAMFCMLLM